MSVHGCYLPLLGLVLESQTFKIQIVALFIDPAISPQDSRVTAMGGGKDNSNQMESFTCLARPRSADVTSRYYPIL